MKYLLSSRTAVLMVSFILLFSAACNTTRRSIPVEQGWDLIGESKVSFIRERTVMRVANGARYTALRFRIEDRDVRLSDLSIYFGNGDRLQPSVDQNITAGQYSRLIDLGLEGRPMDRIEFRYRTVGKLLNGRAHILVYGQRFDPYR